MRESTYTESIHRLVRARGIYAWKVADRFTAGVPDAWYSSKGGDLWVEYKWVRKLPKVIRPALSELQRAWLLTRQAEGRTVAVVVASPEGAVWIAGDDLVSGASARPEQLLSRREIADQISRHVNEEDKNMAPDPPDSDGSAPERS